MVTSVSTGYCEWFAGATFNDTIGRNDVGWGETYLGASRGGVLQSVANPLQVLASSGMNITVSPGAAVVPSASGVTNGAYRPFLNATATLTVATAPVAPNTRIDLVVINITDNGNNTSFGQVELVTGVAGNPPSQPATPANSILLAVISVGSGVSSITQGNIADNRIYAVAPGGVLVCPNMASLPPGSNGQLGYDTTNSRFFHLSGSGAKPIAVLSFPPALSVTSTPQVATFGSEKQLLTASFTGDGSTDVEITGRFAQCTATSGNFTVSVRLYIDATLVQESYANAAVAFSGTYYTNAMIVTHLTSSLKGTTPSAGAHTAKFAIQSFQQTAGQTVTVDAASYKPIELSVKQASL